MPGPPRDHVEHYDSHASYMDRALEGYSRKEVEMAWNYDQYRGENVYASIQETPTLPRGVKAHACDPAPCVAPPLGEAAPREAGLLMPYSALDLQTGLPCGTFGKVPDSHTAHAPYGEFVGVQDCKDATGATCSAATRQYFVLDSNTGEKQVMGNLIETLPSEAHWQCCRVLVDYVYSWIPPYSLLLIFIYMETHSVFMYMCIYI